MRKERLLPSLPWGEGLRAVIGGGNFLVRGVGDVVVVCVGHNGSCKGRSDGGGVFRVEEWGGQRMKRKKTKRWGEWEWRWKETREWRRWLVERQWKRGEQRRERCWLCGREGGKEGGGGVGKGREGCCCHHVLPSGELVTQFWIN